MLLTLKMKKEMFGLLPKTVSRYRIYHANEQAVRKTIIYLKGFDAFIFELSDSELIEALAKQPGVNEEIGKPYNRSEYFIALHGNKIILNELSLRHSERTLVFNFGAKYDRDWVFTGSGGIAFPLKPYIERLKQTSTKTNYSRPDQAESK